MREMKNSGIEWIGDIPSHWIVHPVGCFFGERKNINKLCTEDNLLSLSYGRVIKKDINTNGGLLPESFNTYNIVEADDIIIRPTDLQNDKRSLRTGLVHEHGIITSAYICLRPSKKLDSRYYHFLLHAYDIMKVFYNMGNGVRQGLNYSEFARLLVFEPTYDEQVAIANFLDSKCSEIDALMSDIQSQIETLEQYKRSVITEAVTKGLDPNADMKDSGIEWIGEIPKHWTVMRFKYAITEFAKGNGITKEDVVVDGDSPCVRYGEIYSRYKHSFRECITRTNKQNVKTPRHFSCGDLLFAGTGELIEEIGKSIVYLGGEMCLAGGDIIVAKHKQNPSFLNYTMNCHHANAQKSSGKMKLKVVHISSYDIGNIVVALPPKEEQDMIAHHLDSICGEIDACISSKKEQLSVLEVYKKSLIYEYVTGKKEVV